MRADGRASNLTHASSGERPDCCARANQYTVSRSDIDQDAGTYTYSGECVYYHAYTYELAHAARGHSLTFTNSHVGTYELSHADASTDQHADAISDGHSSTYESTIPNPGTESHKCSNGSIHSRSSRHIVTYTYTRPHCYAGTNKLAYHNAYTTTHRCPDRHAHTDAHSHRGRYGESDRKRR